MAIAIRDTKRSRVTAITRLESQKTLKALRKAVWPGLVAALHIQRHIEFLAAHCYDACMANNAVHCSFCGRSSDDAGKMLEGRDNSPVSNKHVSICLQCAAEAVEVLSIANPDQAIGTPRRKFALGDRVRVSQSYDLEYLRGVMGTIIIRTPDRRSDGIYVVEFEGSTVSYGEGYAVAGMEFESRFLESVD